MCHPEHIGCSFLLVYSSFLFSVPDNSGEDFFLISLCQEAVVYIPACLYNRPMFLWVRMNTFLMLLNLEKSVETQA